MFLFNSIVVLLFTFNIDSSVKCLCEYLRENECENSHGASHFIAWLNEHLGN